MAEHLTATERAAIEGRYAAVPTGTPDPSCAWQSAQDVPRLLAVIDKLNDDLHNRLRDYKDALEYAGRLRGFADPEDYAEAIEEVRSLTETVTRLQHCYGDLLLEHSLLEGSGSETKGISMANPGSGKWVDLKPVPHRCRPPVDETHCGPGLLHATAPLGSVWECECGRLWRVRNDIQFGPAWFRAGWFTRRKYRRGK